MTKKPKEKETTSRKAKLKELLRQTNKDLGIEKAVRFGKDTPNWQKISTGVKEIDEILGGGFPYGHFSVIWGGEGAGKSTICYTTIAEAQKLGKIVYYINLEQSYDELRAKAFGVNTDDLIIGEFPKAEMCLDTIIKYSKEKVVDVIILDSIHSLSPKAEQEDKKGEKSLESESMALLARKLSQFFRMAMNPVATGNVAVILVGQTRTSIGFIAMEQLTGGHCFDEKTRILTTCGLKNINEIKKGDLIPTVNFENKQIENKPIKEVYTYDYDGKLNSFKNKYNDEFLFTDNHNCLVKKFYNGKLNYPLYKDIKAKDNRRTFGFPICFPSNNKEYNIKDDELRLIGWIVTDGSVYNKDKIRGNQILIWQTKYWIEIKELLDRLNIEYRMDKKENNEKRIEFKNTKTSYTFYFYKAKKTVEKYDLNHNKILPKWIFNISDRQAKILFEAMMRGDGNRVKEYNKYICDEKYENMERLAYFLITHNIPISKIKKSKVSNCYYILLRKCDYFGFWDKQKVKYKGKIWDISVDNSYHFIEREGRFIITHNSLKHYSVLTMNIRRGAKANAPKKKGEIVGFDAVLTINKTKTPGTKPELTKIHIPYNFEEGFNERK